MCYAFKIYGEKFIATQVVVGLISSLGHMKIERLRGPEALLHLSLLK